MKIVHLCDDLMNLYGDYGNVKVLERRLGSGCVTVKLTIGDEMQISDADVIYIGSGTERNQKVALSYLRANRDKLKEALDRGAVFLATGNSFEMFGKSITDKNGKKFEGLWFFDYETVERNERTVTDAQCRLIGTDVKLIGFINKASETVGVSHPLFEMTEGAGNCASESVEGVSMNRFFGTHIIGPILARNPDFLDWFAAKIENR